MFNVADRGWRMHSREGGGRERGVCFVKNIARGGRGLVLTYPPPEGEGDAVGHRRYVDPQDFSGSGSVRLSSGTFFLYGNESFSLF